MKWQPMETAPKDGTEVLTAALVAEVVIVRNARWVNAEEWLDEDEADAGWWSYRSSVAQETLDGIFTPKYWAPMPEGLPE